MDFPPPPPAILTPPPPPPHMDQSELGSFADLPSPPSLLAPYPDNTAVGVEGTATGLHGGNGNTVNPRGVGNMSGNGHASVGEDDPAGDYDVSTMSERVYAELEEAEVGHTHALTTHTHMS